MSNFDFEKHQQEHAKALKAEAEAKASYEAAQKAWDAKIQDLIAADSGLADLKAALDKSQSQFNTAKDTTKSLRANVKAELEKDFIENLPAGYTQNDGKSIEIADRQTFFRNCLTLGGSEFLKIDDDAVQELAKLAKKDSQSKQWKLEHKATWLPGCELQIRPKAMISDAKLKVVEPVVVETGTEERRISPQPLNNGTDSAEKKTQIPLAKITF